VARERGQSVGERLRARGRSSARGTAGRQREKKQDALRELEQAPQPLALAAAVGAAPAPPSVTAGAAAPSPPESGPVGCASPTNAAVSIGRAPIFSDRSGRSIPSAARSDGLAEDESDEVDEHELLRA